MKIRAVKVHKNDSLVHNLVLGGKLNFELCSPHTEVPHVQCLKHWYEYVYCYTLPSDSS